MLVLISMSGFIFTNPQASQKQPILTFEDSYLQQLEALTNPSDIPMPVKYDNIHKNI